MKKLLLAATLIFGLAAPAQAQGTLTIAGNVQQNANGLPLSGGLLYTYVVNTVGAAQTTFQDINLSVPNQWPLQADQNGRLPFFYLPSGSVHARLTDSAGNPQFDYPNMLVIGGASGGGGGGQAVDPTSIASTGDVKYRLSGENLAGWVILNGLTIGSASSGATGLANAAAQNLFVYLWANCPNNHCPVSPGGRGASGLADFNANKQLQLMDMRDSIPVGRDCMGSSCLGGLLASNIASGGGDSTDTPGAFGGVANQPITLTTLPNLTLPASVSGGTSGSLNVSVNVAGGIVTTGGSAIVTGGVYGGTAQQIISYGGGSQQTFPVPSAAISVAVPSEGGSFSGSGTGSTSGSLSVGAGGSASLSGGNVPLPVMNPFKLGTWYIKL